MSIFICIYIALVLISIFKRKDERIALFMLLFMFVINLFRGISVGSDTINYYTNQFYGEYTLDFSSSYELEWIFQTISAFIKSTALDPRWCLYSLSIITYGFLYLSYRRFKNLLGTSLIYILLFYFIFDFYSLSFNIARQMAALSLLLYAYSFLYNCKWKFFLYVVIAAGFHISSLLFVLIFLFRNFDINKFKSKDIVLTSYIFLIIIFISKTYLWNIVLSNFPALSLYEHLMGDTKIGSFSIFSLFLESFRLGLGLYVLVRLKNIGINEYNTLFFLSLIGVILMNSFFGNVSRIFLGISVVRIIGFSALYSRKYLSCNDKVAYWITVLFYGIFTLSSLNNGAYEIVPYIFDY